MAGPVTYLEWTEKLQRFGKGDDSVLSELEEGTFDIDAGTVYRFYNKVHETYVERKKLWVDKINRIFQVQYIKTENDISIVLQNAKGNLQPIAKFIRLKAFPEELQKTLKKDFEDFVSSIRKNMKEPISKSNKNYEKIILLINSFNFYETEIKTDSVSKSQKNSKTEEISNNRRIIF